MKLRTTLLMYIYAVVVAVATYPWRFTARGFGLAGLGLAVGIIIFTLWESR